MIASRTFGRFAACIAAGLFIAACAGARAGAPLAASAVAGAAQPPKGTVQGNLESGGLNRTYLLRLPSGAAPVQRVPLVIVLHGGGGNGLSTMERTHFDKVADAGGFIVAFPDAHENRWNDGRGIAKYTSQRENVDDVAFLRDMIAVIARDYPVDLTRVYATGMSNGGLMVHRLACEAGETFAAIAPVEGRMPENTVQTCSTAVTMPMLIVQGTASPLFEKSSRRLTALETARFWAQRNGCAMDPQRSVLEDRDPTDGLYSHEIRFTSCRDSADVVFLSVEGGGHTWPGGAPYLPAEVVGKTTHDFDASAEIWRFFSGRHR